MDWLFNPFFYRNFGFHGLVLTSRHLILFVRLWIFESLYHLIVGMWIHWLISAPRYMDTWIHRLIRAPRLVDTWIYEYIGWYVHQDTWIHGYIGLFVRQDTWIHGYIDWYTCSKTILNCYLHWFTADYKNIRLFLDFTDRFSVWHYGMYAFYVCKDWQRVTSCCQIS